MMRSTVTNPKQSTPHNSLDRVRGKDGIVDVDCQLPSPDCHPVSIALSAVVKDALQRHYGKLDTAAREMEMDAGQLSRELATGHFRLEKLERLDFEAQAFVARALHEAFGESDPKIAARRLIRMIRRCCDELTEVIP